MVRFFILNKNAPKLRRSVFAVREGDRSALGREEGDRTTQVHLLPLVSRTFGTTNTFSEIRCEHGDTFVLLNAALPPLAVQRDV